MDKETTFYTWDWTLTTEDKAICKREEYVGCVLYYYLSYAGRWVNISQDMFHRFIGHK